MGLLWKTINMKGLNLSPPKSYMYIGKDPLGEYLRPCDLYNNCAFGNGVGLCNRKFASQTFIHVLETLPIRMGQYLYLLHKLRSPESGENPGPVGRPQ